MKRNEESYDEGLLLWLVQSLREKNKTSLKKILLTISTALFVGRF